MLGKSENRAGTREAPVLASREVGIDPSGVTADRSDL